MAPNLKCFISLYIIKRIQKLFYESFSKVPYYPMHWSFRFTLHYKWYIKIIPKFPWIRLSRHIIVISLLLSISFTLLAINICQSINWKWQIWAAIVNHLHDIKHIARIMLFVHTTNWARHSIELRGTGRKLRSIHHDWHHEITHIWPTFFFIF